VGPRLRGRIGERSCRALAALLIVLAAACAGRIRRSRLPDPDQAAWTPYPALKVLQGRASYYHDSLAGNLTANGEVYDLDRLTAASRDLPFGTIVRVIRLDTGHRIVVRINDRGPFGDRRRILDLSRAAATRLQMLRRGVVPIRAEILAWGSPHGRYARSARRVR
jgi:rare lipoprotein A